MFVEVLQFVEKIAVASIALMFVGIGMFLLLALFIGVVG